MYYLRARYYNPEISRFISEDPIKDGLNWYAYAGNNPVMFVDPSGLNPTLQEAAAMADHIYKYDMTDDIKDRTVVGWQLAHVIYGSESMKMGIYIPEGEDIQNPSEYAIVFRGTSEWLTEDFQISSEAKNNVAAYVSGTSTDINDAIFYGKFFVNSHLGYDITFVGHSKGGGEAIAAASATGKDAITFNAANFNFSSYNISNNNKQGIKNYYVAGEILSWSIGTARYGTTYWLPVISGSGTSISERYMNHDMDVVKKVLGI